MNASFGLGEAIVSGIVTPDTYIVDSGEPSHQLLTQNWGLLVSCTRIFPVS
ncbi:PEP/pyruvate-binding domain-containing protein [Oceanirhabdus seepicola]|uniref:Pyruvate phosphate dikinase AMP/ATP-binding domain-containing protein n=1 Tax=Oceanirhabdus seepicola TaxID=2828781 RepID=A0A9J6NWI7_9CLOT|nr:hypothetical protein [Oceanirhabdus seepicola]